MAVAASPHASDGKRQRPAPSAAGLLVRLGAAAAVVLVVQARQRRSQVRDDASAPAVAPATPPAAKHRTTVMPVVVACAAVAASATAAVTFAWSREAVILLLLLLLLLLAFRGQAAQPAGPPCSLQVLTEVPSASQADGEPAVTVSRRGQTTHVYASVAVASSSTQLWGIVRACLNGESVGVLRDVKRAEVLDRPAPGVCTLAQRVTWRAGLLRGENNLLARVHTNDAARSLAFVQLNDDPILRAYSGRLSVHGTGAESCVLEMQQQAEGQRTVIAHLAGSTVLGSTLRAQTRAMLQDFKTAAEAAR